MTLVLLVGFHAQAVEIKEVRSQSGVTALLVEELYLAVDLVIITHLALALPRIPPEKPVTYV